MLERSLENRLTPGLQALLADYSSHGGDLRDMALEYLLSVKPDQGQTYRQYEDRIAELEECVDRAQYLVRDLDTCLGV